MFHEIVSISDMTTADGKRMEEQFLKISQFKGTRDQFFWPHKHRVTPEDFRQ